MTLGIFLWMILFMVLNADEGLFTLYGIIFLVSVVVAIIYGIYCKD